MPLIDGSPDQDDTLYGTETADTIRGDRGDDILYGRGDDDSILGGQGNDILYGEAGNDFINGKDGNDTLNGGSGNNTLVGGSGNDWFKIERHANTQTIIEDYTSEDLIDFSDFDSYLQFSISDDGNGNAIINLYDNQTVKLIGHSVASFNGDLFYGSNGWFQYLEGTNNADVIVASPEEEVILGRSGDDTIQASASDDTVLGNEGSDSIIGGAGNDFIEGNQDQDTIEGRDGDDTIKGGTGNDSINGGEDNDSIQGDFGDDTIYGGLGNDIIHGDNPHKGDQPSDGEDLSMEMMGLQALVVLMNSMEVTRKIPFMVMVVTTRFTDKVELTHFTVKMVVTTSKVVGMMIILVAETEMIRSKEMEGMIPYMATVILVKVME